MLQISMNAMRMLKTTAGMCVSIVQGVTIVSVQMDSKCLKTTRLVTVQKVSRSRSIGQCAWVSNNTKTVELFPPSIFVVLIGTLSKDDDDGSENVVKKNEFALFQT